MNDYRPYELMVKQMQGSITNEENAELEALFIARPQLKTEFEGLKATWDATGSYEFESPVDVDLAWEKVRKQVRFNDSAQLISFSYRKTFAIAASILLVFGIGLWLYHNVNILAWKQVSTLAETKRLELEDGSVVWLNKNSVLEYPAKFGATRNIKLNGEAFFEVAKDAANPFIIFAGGTTTQVLGTSFNVRAYSTETDIEVSVTTGKVWFSAKQDSEKLVSLPGYTGRYYTKAAAMEKLKTGDNYLAWKTGELVFNHTMVPEVLRDLEKYYGIKLKIKDTAVTSVSFSGGLNRQPLNSALEILKSSLGLRIIRDSAQYYSVYSN